MQPETNSLLSSQPSLNLRSQLAASQQPQTPDSGARFSEEFDRATRAESSTDAELRHDTRREAKASQAQRTGRQETADQARSQAKTKRGAADETRGERTSNRAQRQDDANSELAGPTGTSAPENQPRQQASRRIQFSAGQAQQAQQAEPTPDHNAQAGAAAQAALPQALGPVHAANAASTPAPSASAAPAGVQAAAPASAGQGTSDGGQLGQRNTAARPTPQGPSVEAPEARDAMEKLLVDREERMEREASILRQVKANLKPGGRELSIRLSPAALGRVDMNLAMREGRLTASIRTETTEAFEALEHQLPELQAALESQGIEVMGFDLELNTGDNSRSSFESGGTGPTPSAPVHGDTRLPDARTTQDLTAELNAARATNAHTRGGVDAIG